MDLTKVIVWTVPDGSVRITHPNPLSIHANTVSAEELARHTQSQDPTLAGCSYAIVSKSTLPTDRVFRDAWTAPAGTVVVNMEKAREIHLNHLRELRKEKFIELGVPYKLEPSLEEAMLSKSIQDQLQELRDMPTTVDLSSIQTPEELKEAIPTYLK